MKSVGVKALKNELSKYLQLVRQGQIVLVTDRDEIIAEIRRPSSIRGVQRSRLESFLDDAEHRGAVKRATTQRKLLSLADIPSGPAGLHPILNELREDRF